MQTFKLKSSWPNPGWKRLHMPQLIIPGTCGPPDVTTHTAGTTIGIEVCFTCSSCHAKFMQKFRGTHENYEWLQNHYGKADHVILCESCSASYWDC